MTTQYWEYFTKEFSGGDVSRSTLDYYGAQGWELVSVSPVGRQREFDREYQIIAIFKRMKKSRGHGMNKYVPENADGYYAYFLDEKKGTWAEGNFRDGKAIGFHMGWFENGQKESEGNFKDDKQHGFWTGWYENGQKANEGNFWDGKCMSAEVWKPNGEKCPVTNVKDGNGVGVDYNEDGTEMRRETYKDGELVED